MKIFKKNVQPGNVKGLISDEQVASVNASDEEIITMDAETSIIKCSNSTTGDVAAVKSYDASLFASRVSGWDRFCVGIIDAKTHKCLSSQVIYLNAGIRKTLSSAANANEGVLSIIASRKAVNGRKISACRFVREPLVLLDPASKKNYGCTLLAFVE